MVFRGSPSYNFDTVGSDGILNGPASSREADCGIPLPEMPMAWRRSPYAFVWPSWSPQTGPWPAFLALVSTPSLPGPSVKAQPQPSPSPGTLPHGHPASSRASSFVPRGGPFLRPTPLRDLLNLPDSVSPISPFRRARAVSISAMLECDCLSVSLSLP